MFLIDWRRVLKSGTIASKRCLVAASCAGHFLRPMPRRFANMPVTVANVAQIYLRSTNWLKRTGSQPSSASIFFYWQTIEVALCANEHQSPAWQRFFVDFRDEFGGISLYCAAPRGRSLFSIHGANSISVKTFVKVRVLYSRMMDNGVAVGTNWPQVIDEIDVIFFPNRRQFPQVVNMNKFFAQSLCSSVVADLG